MRRAVAASLCALAFPARAAPIVDVRIDYYTVGGGSAVQVRQALNDAGPFDPPRGRRFDARTDWRVNWRFWWRQAGGLCTIDRTEVRLTITYVLPRLSDSARLSRAELDRWDSYRAALKTHEDGHAQHGRDAARGVESTLLALPPQPCAQIEAVVNEAAQQVIAEFNRRDIEYDQRTGHGATQGARFP